MSDSPAFIGNRLIIFVSIFTPLQIIVVALRFYARSLTPRRFGVDDVLVASSLLGQFVATGLCIGCIKQAGVGYHVEWVVKTHPQWVTNFFKYLVAISSWYWFTISLSKLAICVFYRTLFPQRIVLVIISITAGVMICTSVASIIAGLAACRPFDTNWASTAVQATHCIDKEKLYVWSTFPNIITDVVLLVLPLPIVWKLQASRQLKIALSGTFVLGSIGIVASILRFLAFNNTNSFTDATWNAVELYIWTLAEPSIYLIASSLMTYRPLLEKFGPKYGTKVTQWTGRSARITTSGAETSMSRTKLSAVHSAPESDEGILLPHYKKSGHVFEQLADPDYGEDRSGIPRTPASGIMRTTNVQMSWN